jgi:hypothetical protein
MISDFQSFLNESRDNYIPHELAWITLRRLVNQNDILARDFYLSQDDRKSISSEWGKSLPRGFAGPTTPMSVGNLLGPALHDNPTWIDMPYFDDADLVFGDWPLVFKCKVENRRISSTWGDLGEWLKEHMDLEGFLAKWLESDMNWNEFTHKYRGAITGKKYNV